MRTKIGVVLAAGLAALFATAMAAGSASADVSGAHSTFAEQGRAAGLTTTQTIALQAKVDTYLAKLGGTQVALDQIDLHGATVFIALPGEAHPRALPATAGTNATFPHVPAARTSNISAPTAGRISPAMRLTCSIAPATPCPSDRAARGTTIKQRVPRPLSSEMIFRSFTSRQERTV
ncbi:MAG TPA: hypothetical protein VF892_19300 [Pseudonocardiaceae bacterium]